jgi:Sigma-70, region 4
MATAPSPTRSEGLRGLKGAIDTLPERQQTVIVLRDVEGWPSEEVCSVLDLSEGKERVLRHRARSKVSAALERYFAGATEPPIGRGQTPGDRLRARVRRGRGHARIHRAGADDLDAAHSDGVAD